MNNELKSKVEDCVRSILKHQADKKFAESRLEAFKEELTSLCDSGFDELFDSDGVCKLENAKGLVKTALNPFKVIYVKDDRPLTADERRKLAEIFNEKGLNSLTKLDLDVQGVYAAMEKNKVLDRLLNQQKITIKQDTRYDVKPLPQKS